MSIDIYLVILFFGIINTTFSTDSRENSINILEELVDVDQDDLPTWKTQREVFQHYLCSSRTNDSDAECNLVEKIIQNMEENMTDTNNIVRKIFNETDLYGARSGENVDQFSIDETIRNFMFIEIFGTKADFLIFILDSVLDRQTISAIAYNEEIQRKLSKYKMRDSNATLPNNVVNWIMDNLIHPLLPNLKKIPDVFSYDYAYSQAGMAFAKSLKLNLRSLSEEELISISQLVETSSKLNQINISHMRIFMFPVLINYFHRHKDAKENLKTSLLEGNFDWTKAFHEFFDEMHKQMNSPVIQYFSAISSYRNRTAMAKDIIEEKCTKHGFYGDVTSYKNFGNKYHCIEKQYMIKNEFLLYLLNLLNLRPRWPGETLRLPDVTQLFEIQNRHIAARFKDYEQYIITLALKDDTQVKKDIENQTVHKSEIYTSLTVPTINVRTAPGPIVYKKLMSEKVDIFGFSESSSTNPADCSKYYAVIRDASNIAFSAYNKNYPTSFYMDVVDSDVNSGVFKDIKIHCIASSILKKSEENETQLATSIASDRAAQLFKYLKESGMDETGLEKFSEFVFSLIPFYEGIRKIMNGEITEGKLRIILDALAFIPIAGYSIKITYALFKSFAVSALRVMLANESILMAIRMGISPLASTAQRLLFSRAAFAEIGKMLLRSIDPGFELVYSISKGAASLILALSRKFPILSRMLNVMKNAEIQILKTPGIKKALLPHYEGLSYISKIGKYAGNNVYVKIRPFLQESKNVRMYGRTYLELPNNKYGELRNLLHRPFQIPVRLSADFKLIRKRVFSELDITTGEVNGLRLIENEHGKLEYKNIESMCLKSHARTKRHNQNIVDATASPSELMIANALSCSVDEARTLLTQYFLETNYARNWFIRAIRLEGRIPDIASSLRLRFPELLYGFQMFTPITRPIMITDLRRTLHELYSLEELHRIGIDINQGFMSLVSSYNECIRRGTFLSFEDYFALKNFGLNGCSRIAEETNEAMQMRNALRRLTIMQSFRLRRGKTFRAYGYYSTPVAFVNDNVVPGEVLHLYSDYLTMSTNVINLLSAHPRQEEGMIHFLFEVRLESDSAVADLHDIYRDTLVLHRKHLPLTVRFVRKFDITDLPHLGSVNVIGLTHGLVERSYHVTQLMDGIEGLHN